jgi:hypothetical protein
MLGSGDPTPYDAALVLLLLALAVLLAAGAVTAGVWSPAAAAAVRRGAALLAVCATAVVLVRTPTTSGIVGAGRVISVWPALAAAGLAYLAWSWRAGRP